MDPTRTHTPSPPGRSAHWPGLIGAALAGYALLSGLIALLGWVLDVPRLAAWFGHEIIVQPNAALAGGMLGLSLLLLSAGRRRAAAGPALIGGMIGLLTLVENIASMDLGIDRLLLSGREWGVAGTAAPGRMGLPASLSWTMLGAGALLATSGERGPRRIAAGLAIASSAVAMLSIIGYLYGANTLFTLPRVTAIALPTATMVLAAACALATTLPELPPLAYLRDQGAAGVLARRALPLALLVPVVVGWLRWLGQREQLYDPAFGSALRTLVEMGLLTGLLWWGLALVRGRERLIRDSGELHRAVIDGSDDCIKVLDLTGRLIDINSRGRELTGFRGPQDWAGKPWPELWSEADRADARAAVAAAAAGGRGEFTAALAVADGRVRRWEVAITPLRDAEGRPQRLLTVSRDVTERRAAEDAVRDGERRLRELVDAIPAAVYTTDAEGRITYFNRAAAEFAGREPAIGERWCITWKLEHTDGTPLPHDQCPMAVTLREGRPVRGAEAVAVRPDGRKVCFQPFPTPLFDDQGTLTGGINMLVDITERRQQALTAARLAAIVESSDDAIVAKDLNGVVQSWNRGAERIFGFTAEEAVGTSIAIIIPPDRLAEEAEVLSRIRRGEKVDHFETQRRTKDGRLIEISLAVSPIRDPQGKVVGASKIARDITSRKQAEQALREQDRVLAERARVLEALNRTGAALAAELDLQKLLQMVTDAGTEVSGAQFGAFFYNVARPQGESFMLYTLSGAPREAFDKFGMPRNTAVFSHTFAGRGVVRSDDITKDPRYGKNHPHRGMPEGHLPVRAYLAVPVISRAGTVIGGLFFGHPQPGVFTQEAERVVTGIASQAAVALDNARLYEDVRRGEERYRAIVESQAEMVCRFKADGTVIFVNSAYARARGTTAEVLAAANFWEFVNAEDRPHVEAMLGRLTPQAPEAIIENRFATAQGERWTLWTNRALVFDESGRATEFQSSGIDITARREAEAELARHRDHLEQMVQERTRQLEESAQRLRMSERLAGLGTLAAGVGHDMGNLLIPLKMRIESLEAQDLAPAAREDLTAVRTCADYLQKLGSGLRSLAVEPGRGGPREAVDLGPWWTEAQAVCRAVLPRGVALHADMPEGPCWVGISKPALTQAVFNLAQNAGDALRDRSDGEVTVTARTTAEGVELAVRDNGPGMPPEVRAHCLEPFFTTKPRGISTGLGLALVHGLVTDAGGSVDVNSEPGQGAEFVLRLPEVDAVAEGPRLRAVVDVADPRLRAIVHQQLSTMQVVVQEGGPAELHVLDEAGRARLPASGPTVLLGRANGHARPGLFEAGERPTMRAIRGAIQAAVAQARMGGAA